MPEKRARPAVSAARVRVMSLAIVPAVNSCGDVAYLLQCRFYLHKVVDVELHGIAVLLPHLAGYEDGIMQRPLGLFQSGLQVVHGVLPVLRRRYSPGTVFAGKFFSPITLQLLSPEMKSAYPWHTSQEHALTTADTKRAGSPTRSAGCLPSFCLFRAGFSYSVALMPPFCFRRQPFRQAVPPPFQPCRSWSFSRLAFRGWRGSGRNPWRCG